MEQEELSSSIERLKPGDYIAFEWKYGTLGPEIMVTNITSVGKNYVLVHFLDGYKSEAEFVKKGDIIAIGDTSATGKIKHWIGNFNILQPNHPLLN